MKQKIVIIGGGYGGLRAAEKLCANADTHVTLIDKNHYHYLQTEMYEFVSGRLNICDITYNLQKFSDSFSNFSFVCDKAVDIQGKNVIGEKSNYLFDYLVIAVGTEDLLPENFKDYAYVVKDLSSAFELKRSFMQKLFLEVTLAGKPVNIVIGGAGQSGVELAADIVSYAQECSYEAGYSCGVNVTLIEGGEIILPGSEKYIQKHAHKRLEDLGISILLNTFIEDVDEEYIHIENRAISYDIFIFSGGTKSVSFVEKLAFPKSEDNLLQPNAYLQLAPDIFVIGDCALILDDKKQRLAPTAQIAEQSAEYVAKYILKQEKKKFEGKIYGMFTALGKHYAVGHIFHTFYLKGPLAYFIKAAITKLYAYGIKTKINSAFFKR